MKKNFEIIIGQYVLFSNQNIGIIDAIDVIQIALKKNKFNKIFQYKKQKYIVEFLIDYDWYEIMGIIGCRIHCNDPINPTGFNEIWVDDEWKKGDPPGLGVNWRPD